MIAQSAPQISGPMGELFGRDPLQFALAYTRKRRARVIDLLHRMVQRTGQTTWKMPAENGGTYSADLVPHASDSNLDLATKLQMVLKRNPDVALDEVRRRSFGLAVGLDGDTTQTSTGGSNDDAFDFNALTELANNGVTVLGGLLGLRDSEDPKPGQTVQVTSAPTPWAMIALAGIAVYFLVIKKG